MLVSGMVVVPLLSLLHVGDGLPGVEAHTGVVAAGASAASDDGAAMRAALAERSVALVASRSRSTLLSREDAALANATTTSTTVPPAPSTTAVRARVRPKPAAVKVAPKPASTPTTAARPVNEQHGGASFYAPSLADECAHRTLPFGTIVTVTNVANGKSTTCRIGDRGPFVAGRVIDLSRQRFAELASTSAGVISVRLTW
jgi:rare lipoprotein A